MKKLITICVVTFLLSAGASAQTAAGTKKFEKKTVKQKVLKSLQSKETKAKLQTTKQLLRKEGE